MDDLHLPQSLAAWPGERFAATLTEELGRADPGQLRLERLLRHGSHVVEAPDFIILGSEDSASGPVVRLGVFLKSVLAGCACADDPTPVDTMNEYGEIEILIEEGDAHARIRPLDR